MRPAAPDGWTTVFSHRFIEAIGILLVVIASEVETISLTFVFRYQRFLFLYCLYLF